MDYSAKGGTLSLLAYLCHLDKASGQLQVNVISPDDVMKLWTIRACKVYLAMS